MRNLGIRFNASNVINLAGNNADELAKAYRLLCCALDCELHSVNNTPSADRVLQGLVDWYGGNCYEGVTFRNSPAYAYVNMNTGINLLFLWNNPHAPIMAVEIGLMTDKGVDSVAKTLKPGTFD